MQNTGGQLGNDPSEILVCIIDDSYGKASELDEEEQYLKYGRELRAEFAQDFEEVDVAPGFSLPAYATLVEFVSSYWPAIVATFFLAKPVSENLQVWRDVATSVKRYFSRPEIVLGRNAAAALAIEAVFDDMGGMPKSITCNGYYWKDRRFTGDELPTAVDNEICDPPRVEYLSMAIQVFRISADGIDFEVEVDGKTVIARRV